MASAQRRLSGTLQDMRLAWEEPFGPVVPVVRVKTVEEAVDHCNANNLALQGCVFTRDVDAGVSPYFVFHPLPSSSIRTSKRIWYPYKLFVLC